jgi:hypothetical protein
VFFLASILFLFFFGFSFNARVLTASVLYYWSLGRKLKCDQNEPCSNCLTRPGQKCNYQPVIRRRGPGRKNLRGGSKGRGAASSSSREASSSKTEGGGSESQPVASSSTAGRYPYGRPESPPDIKPDIWMLQQQTPSAAAQIPSHGIEMQQEGYWPLPQPEGRGRSSPEGRENSGEEYSIYRRGGTQESTDPETDTST